MPERGQSGKGRGALGGFAERLERGSPLSDICASQRQIGLLQSIATHAPRQFRRTHDHGPGARLIESRGPASLFTGRNAPAKIRAVAALGCELGFDVFRIDPMRVVSKHIGETQKNPQAHLRCS